MNGPPRKQACTPGRAGVIVDDGVRIGARQ